MRILIIHDNEGVILSTRDGDQVREPIGVPFIWADIPDGKRLKVNENGIGVDVSVTPHVPILEDIPKTETELLKEEVGTLKQTNAELTAANELLAESLIEFKMQYTSVPCQLHQEYPAIVDGLIEGAKTDGTV